MMLHSLTILVDKTYEEIEFYENCWKFENVGSASAYNMLKKY